MNCTRKPPRRGRGRYGQTHDSDTGQGKCAHRGAVTCLTVTQRHGHPNAVVPSANAHLFTRLLSPQMSPPPHGQWALCWICQLAGATSCSLSISAVTA